MGLGLQTGDSDQHTLTGPHGLIVINLSGLKACFNQDPNIRGDGFALSQHRFA